jgi:hypothetical protein
MMKHDHPCVSNVLESLSEPILKKDEGEGVSDHQKDQRIDLINKLQILLTSNESIITTSTNTTNHTTATTCTTTNVCCSEPGEAPAPRTREEERGGRGATIQIFGSVATGKLVS